MISKGLMSKVKNTNSDFSNLANQIKDHVHRTSGSTSKRYIPDIIEFCNSPKYLNLPVNGITLFPIQSIILKVFYRGQEGNENIALTDEEVALLTEYGQQDVLDKYYAKSLFRELILVLGRRSGKDLLCSLIALYEAMKLLEVPGGSPYKYYGLGPGNPLYIVTVATAADQAKILFTEIRAKLQLSRYFSDKIGAIDSEEIFLLTPEDKEKNQDLITRGLGSAVVKGSIIVKSGHSNSDSLLGKNYFALLFDEVASFKTSGGPASGDRIYTALGPGTATFARPLYVENGKETTNPNNAATATPVLDTKGRQAKRLDSKIISISSPRGEEGIFHRLFKESVKRPSTLSFQLPTWKVNLNLTEEMLRSENTYMTTNEFQMEFGAQFSGTGGEKFIPSRYVDEAVDIGQKLGLDQKIAGRPGIVYYAHLDPASTSHNYALVVVHVEDRVRMVQKDQGVPVREKFKMVVIDHMQVWKPTPNEMINVSDVDKYILGLSARFRFGMVTYDAWNSASSIQMLRSKGVPTKMTPFRRQYIMQIYTMLEDLLVNNHLAIPNKGPYADLLQTELKCLKRIYTTNGFKIKADKEAVVTTDDLCDALAGAIGTALAVNRDSYPRGTTVYMPQPGMNSQVWHVGQNDYTTAGWRELQVRSGKKF